MENRKLMYFFYILFAEKQLCGYGLRQQRDRNGGLENAAALIYPLRVARVLFMGEAKSLRSSYEGNAVRTRSRF